ncbi:4-hydroxy-tetrahydrodipicolinate synthase [subsurface metagenome]
MSMTLDELKKRLKGIIPVQYCPYTKEKELDVAGLRENTQFLVDFAQDGNKDVVLMTNGSTTEFYANSIEEQKTVIKTVVETVGGRIPVVVGAMQAAAERTIEMVKYAEEAGADCAMIVLPYYHTPSKEGMYRYYEAVADAVNIGIMIYNNPDVSGTLIPPDLMARLAKIDNIVATKDNATNAADYAFKALTIDPEDMVLLNGCGEVHYVGSAAYGLKYRGFVNFIGNFAPALSYAVYQAVEAGDFRRALEALRAQMPVWSLLSKFNKKRESISVIPECLRTNYMYMGIGKAAMDIAGLHGGPLRLPMEDLIDEEKQELKEALKEMGVI